MKHNSNITYKAIATGFTMALFFPLAVTFLHAFGHSDHKHCTETSTLHFHEKPLNCELCDFSPNPAIQIGCSVEVVLPQSNFKTIFSSYTALSSSYSQLHFNLRGPPKPV